jgi:hypothetical protein
MIQYLKKFSNVTHLHSSEKLHLDPNTKYLSERLDPNPHEMNTDPKNRLCQMCTARKGYPFLTKMNNLFA